MGYEQTSERATYESWHAPELNFKAVRLTTSRLLGPNTQLETVLTNFRRVGEEPDPSYFQIPEGFETIEE